MPFALRRSSKSIEPPRHRGHRGKRNRQYRSSGPSVDGYWSPGCFSVFSVPLWLTSIAGRAHGAMDCPGAAGRVVRASTSAIAPAWSCVPVISANLAYGALSTRLNWTGSFAPPCSHSPVSSWRSAENSPSKAALRALASSLNRFPSAVTVSKAMPFCF